MYEHLAKVSQSVCKALWLGDRQTALDKFLEFWNGPDCCSDDLSPKIRANMLSRANKLASDLTAVFAEENVTQAARGISVPTLLFCGGMSPYLTRRIVRRLASIVPCARARYLLAAGHMLAITHAKDLIPEIVQHLALASESTSITVAA